MPLLQAIITYLALAACAILAPPACAQDESESAVWAANRQDFRVISANPLYGDNDFWVLIARRIPDANSEARKIVATYEAKTNAKLPRISQRVRRIVYEAEARIQQQYRDAELQLEKTVRRAARRLPNNDAVTGLQYDTIPAAEDQVNRAVFDAQQAINQIVNRTQAKVREIVLKAEARVNAAIPKSGPVVTEEVRRIIAEAEQRVEELLVASGREINARIAKGNRVVDANIALVESSANEVLPAEVSRKITADIKQASGEIDDSIAKGQRDVVMEVWKSTKKLKKIVPALEKELKKLKKE